MHKYIGFAMRLLFQVQAGVEIVLFKDELLLLQINHQFLFFILSIFDHGHNVINPVGQQENPA